MMNYKANLRNKPSVLQHPYCPLTRYCYALETEAPVPLSSTQGLLLFPPYEAAGRGGDPGYEVAFKIKKG